MGFRVNSYAKIWKVERAERYTKVNLSTSKKNRDTGEYITDFSGFVMLLGKAHSLAENLSEGDRIKILACDVETSYDKEKNVKYTDFLLFDYEDAGTSNGEPSSKTSTPKNIDVESDAGNKAVKSEGVEDDSDDLPF